ncbi:hypothetical protein BX600DRAFT_458406 [Xylariales sp. PMI_506]|nr:hypothetical protein BX600DRAFT_458406 [Xylariales sp. PMI_506]
MATVNNEIRGRLALITGASGGIGAACARALWAEGASLALTCYKNRQSVDELARELLSSAAAAAAVADEETGSRKISVHVVDTSSVADIERLFEDLRREHGAAGAGGAAAQGEEDGHGGGGGGPDILVSNAGHGKRIPDILDIPLDEFDYTLSVNLRASFVLTKLAVPHMKAQGWGRLVYVSSIAGLGGGINGCHCKCAKRGRNFSFCFYWEP